MTEVGYVRVTDEARMERKNVTQGGIFGGRSDLFESHCVIRGNDGYDSVMLQGVMC